MTSLGSHCVLDRVAVTKPTPRWPGRGCGGEYEYDGTRHLYSVPIIGTAARKAAARKAAAHKAAAHKAAAHKAAGRNLVLP